MGGGVMMKKNTYKTIVVKERELPREELRKGMTIAKDIIASNNNILVKEGYVIKNEYAVKKVQQILERYNIETIQVKVEETGERNIEAAKLVQEIIKGDVEKSNNISQQKDSYSKVLEITNKKEAKLIDKLIPHCRKNITDKMLLLFNGADASEVQSIEQDIKNSMEIINTSVNVPQMLEKIKRMDDSLYFYNYSIALTSYMIGKWMHWDQKKREELFITAMLADIGILHLPEDKRYKDQWQEENINEYYQHAIYSQRLLTKCSFITKDMLNSILHHHEKYDGSGYPRNLRGKSIPLLSRVIYLADLYTFYTISKRYNALYAVNVIKEQHLNEVDIDLFFTLSKRIFDYFSGQTFQSNGSASMEGEIITFDHGTGNSIFDQTNINVYVRQKDKSIVAIPLNKFCEDYIEFT
ncbi:HD-GYP domain, c-di-GMP phosphodiesterase class II (or its inactivated variant) [Anaerovirgula multivorans]|uniref:HD-GYP domain, c-di-GMP phosphodiesterase class II (Or its inactivated variant) n=2 Tax=Anaerovirgula multivorans TaxID=312168 RepID=A0A239G2C6_9FIRM|nr:HD-GYP domain, c-di-GMP phosphodiesterase class II (or its inactivated variant) [Anaerovirgula multivorans]